ncbi:uncharacterized protein LOC132728000 [Ruditapes philippinarum]|uniref:uncharacterized protein LOC132728000 n=1 Tax=Ruditapes philippinarum TaxID=129788 RepID=UPI00295C3518|nr:uncharacterized protein LOC132728000 [Ruditapes philippinarum]
MAAQAKGKSRVKNLKVFFEKVDEDLKQNKTDELCKTIRKDKNVWKTFSDLHDILKKGFSETELRQSEMGKSLVSNIRRSEIFDILPKDIKQDISALSTEENNPVDKKQGEGNTPPTSAKHSRSESPGLDSGPAPVYVIYVIIL